MMPSNSSRLDADDQYQHSSLPEVMYSLACLTDLYELGLIMVTEFEKQDLRQHILTRMSRTICAQGACLLLYYAPQQQFVCAASQGSKIHCGMLATTINSQEMRQVVMRSSAETLTSVQIEGQDLLLVTLSYNRNLLGVVALLLADKDTLHTERGFLLSYMGKVAAIILGNYDLRDSERNESIEQERNRLARDLHDSVTQQIAYVLHKLDFIQHVLEKQQIQLAVAEAKRAANVLEASLHDLRASIHALLPAQLEKQDLAEAISNLVHDYMNTHPTIEVSLSIDNLQHLPARLNLPIFRFIQEALTNIARHAQARCCFIQMRMLPDTLEIEIRDNGIGFNSAKISEHTNVRHGNTTDAIHHFGLQTMRERIQEAGGQWEIESIIGEGTTVCATFPQSTTPLELTRREHEVLCLIAEGLSNRVIAERLSISHDTVKTHIHHIIQKLRVKDRMQAALIAAKQGWL